MLSNIIEVTFVFKGFNFHQTFTDCMSNQHTHVFMFKTAWKAENLHSFHYDSFTDGSSLCFTHNWACYKNEPYTFTLNKDLTIYYIDFFEKEIIYTLWIEDDSLNILKTIMNLCSLSLLLCCVTLTQHTK